MNASELNQLIDRVKRDTRSMDVVTLCDEARQLLQRNQNVVTPTVSVTSELVTLNDVLHDDVYSAVNTAVSLPARDRAAYMRTYRAKKR